MDSYKSGGQLLILTAAVSNTPQTWRFQGSDCPGWKALLQIHLRCDRAMESSGGLSKNSPLSLNYRMYLDYPVRLGVREEGT